MQYLTTQSTMKSGLVIKYVSNTPWIICSLHDSTTQTRTFSSHEFPLLKILIFTFHITLLFFYEPSGDSFSFSVDIL